MNGINISQSIFKKETHVIDSIFIKHSSCLFFFNFKTCLIIRIGIQCKSCNEKENAMVLPIYAILVKRIHHYQKQYKALDNL